MFGLAVLPYLLLQMVIGFPLLEVVNYLEHYGLLRQKRPDGRYERTRPEHSWNSNNVASNVLLYHLQRHSDHHANPTRRFQALRHFDEAPQLPTGYAGMILLALVPPLWRRVMDPRLIAPLRRRRDPREHPPAGARTRAGAATVPLDDARHIEGRSGSCCATGCSTRAASSYAIAPWAQVTMAEIATAAGVSRQTLYNEFGTRDEFGQALVIRESGRLLDAVEQTIAEHAERPDRRADRRARALPDDRDERPVRAPAARRRRHGGPAAAGHHAEPAGSRLGEPARRRHDPRPLAAGGLASISTRSRTRSCGWRSAT